jgi:hypothetical protein
MNPPELKELEALVKVNHQLIKEKWHEFLGIESVAVSVWCDNDNL